MGEKLIPLDEALDLISDGSSLALGGNLLYRVPAAFVRGLVRKGKRDLEVIKTAASYDIDLLSAAGCISRVKVGFVGYENEFGLAQGYRRGVEGGRVKVQEHT